MILGLGIDIVSIERIEGLLERRGGRAAQRLFTPVEQEYCQRMARPALHYAARFAAKESFVKALGTGFSGGIRWNHIGIVHDPRGKPELELGESAARAMQTLGAVRGFVSLTHDPTHAGSVVVLEA